MNKVNQHCPNTYMSVHGKSFSKMSVAETNRKFKELAKKKK